MGYEISVTPLQLAAAYGALANGGVLMEPHLLREVRAPDGAVLAASASRARCAAWSRARVAAPDHATCSWRWWRTAPPRAPRSPTSQVAGKTGTARRTGADGRYEAGSLHGHLRRLLPRRRPAARDLRQARPPAGRLLRRASPPRPVTRETLQGILAARSSRPGRPQPARHAPRADPAPAPPTRPRAPGSADAREGTYVFLLDDGLPQPHADAPRDAVRGARRWAGSRSATPRAARTPSGLQVRLQGSGPRGAHPPAAGAASPAGDTLVLVGDAR